MRETREAASPPKGWLYFTDLAEREDWDEIDDDEFFWIVRDNPEAKVAAEFLLNNADGGLRALGARAAASLPEISENIAKSLTRNLRDYGYLLAKDEASIALARHMPDHGVGTDVIREALEDAQDNKVTQTRAAAALEPIQDIIYAGLEEDQDEDTEPET